MNNLDYIKGSVGEKIKKWESRVVVAATQPKSPHDNRNEGETWVDNDGKQWTKKNGLVQSISKTAQFRMPLWCPKCKKTMSHKFDTKTYNMHGFCYECTMSWHTQMKIDGTYDNWERLYTLREERAWLQDMIKEREDYIRTFRTPQAHYSDGRWDEVAPKQQFNEMLQEVQKDIDTCNARISIIDTEEINIVTETE